MSEPTQITPAPQPSGRWISDEHFTLLVAAIGRAYAVAAQEREAARPRSRRRTPTRPPGRHRMSVVRP